MKKKISFFLFFLIPFTSIFSQEKGENQPLTFLITGASFAMPSNGWFELGCDNLGATPINRAIGGEAIADAANRMIDGTLYTIEELENIDAFVIMQVHNRDVFDKTQIEGKYTNYKTPFDRSNYAAAYDYVIKRYLTDCYNLKFNRKSKYYNTRSGKPAVIVLCTHWHDSRIIYNTTIRQLAAKWGFPLVEFDRYIGFSKNALHPVTEEQTSVIYSIDNQQQTDGEAFGLHPARGHDSYIQQRMAAIFASTMRKIFLIK